MTTHKQLLGKAQKLDLDPSFPVSRMREVAASEGASCFLLGEEVQELAKAALQWRDFSKELFSALVEAEKAQDDARAQLNQILKELPLVDAHPAFAGNIPLYVTAVVGRLQEKALAYDLDRAGIESRDKDAIELIDLRAEVGRLKALIER